MGAVPCCPETIREQSLNVTIAIQGVLTQSPIKTSNNLVRDLIKPPSLQQIPCVRREADEYQLTQIIHLYEEIIHQQQVKQSRTVQHQRSQVRTNHLKPVQVETRSLSSFRSGRMKHSQFAQSKPVGILKQRQNPKSLSSQRSHKNSHVHFEYNVPLRRIFR